MGGPIRKNKTFIFGSWQGQKVNFADPIDKTFGTVNLYSSTALTGIYRYFVVDPGGSASPSTGSGSRRTRRC